MDEIKRIPKFSEYLISRDGKIWSNLSQRFLKPTLDSRGYLQLRLSKNKKQYKKLVHRLVLETFVGSCPNGKECCHNNGIKIDNRLENLRWDTRENNIKDSIKHGTRVDNRGEKQGRAKLNELQVRVIRRLLEFGILIYQEIAEIFDISKSTIGDIKFGRSWNKGV